MCAAVRETFEECGVLLAGPTADTVVSDTAVHREARGRLERRDLSLGTFLAEANLVLRADLLRPWANWITPVVEERRYDTRFFVAVLPTGQRADGATSEAHEVAWRTPAESLRRWRAGDDVLLPRPGHSWWHSANSAPPRTFSPPTRSSSRSSPCWARSTADRDCNSPTTTAISPTCPTPPACKARSVRAEASPTASGAGVVAQ